jgi:PAS domain S-box-containing protein
MNLESLFENFVTSGIKSPDLETVKKFKVLNIFLLIFVLFSPCLGLFYFFISADLLFYATIIAGLLGVSALILLRETKDLVVAGNYAFFVLWATFLIIRWNTGAMTEGGVILLSWIWNAVLILMAIFITGYLWGTIWAILIFVEAGVAVYLFSSGHQFPNLIPPDISPVYSLGAYLSGLFVILLIAFLYERERADIADRERQKSKALVESKSYVDTIIERLTFPTFVVDREHRVIQWNRACQRLTSVPAEEIIGKKVPASLCVDNQWSLADILIEDPNSIVERFSGSIISKTDSGYLEVGIPLPAIRGDFEAIISVDPIRDINGSIKGAIEIIQDVSKLQQEVYKLYDDYDQAVELPSDPTFRIDSKGKIKFWNKACEETFGYPPSQMIGKNALVFVSKSTRRPFQETMARAFKGESFNGKEWKYYSARANPVYVLARGHPFQDSSGKPRECVIVNTDITDLRSRMDDLRREANEAKEKLKSITEEYALLRKNIAAYIRKKK